MDIIYNKLLTNLSSYLFTCIDCLYFKCFSLVIFF